MLIFKHSDWLFKFFNQSECLKSAFNKFTLNNSLQDRRLHGSIPEKQIRMNDVKVKMNVKNSSNSQGPSFTEIYVDRKNGCAKITIHHVCPLWWDQASVLREPNGIYKMSIPICTSFCRVVPIFFKNGSKPNRYLWLLLLVGVVCSFGSSLYLADEVAAVFLSLVTSSSPSFNLKHY